MKLPEFIILGAGKSGTTSLYKYLQQHPNVFFPEKKELYFFAFEGEDKPEGMITQFDRYQAMFESAPEEKVIGEVSSVYLFRPRAAERIHHYLPKAKLIAILRNPADRAFSDYLMHVGNNHFSIIDSKTGKPKEFAKIVKNRSYFIQIGFYYEQLKRYYDRFDADQIKVYLYDDLVTDSQSLVRDLFEFVGVEPDFAPDMSQRHKVSGIPKNRMLNDLVMKKNPIRSLAAKVLKPFMSASVRDRIRNNINKSNLERPQLSGEMRQEMIEIYREDILQLQDILQRDLTAWM